MQMKKWTAGAIGAVLAVAAAGTAVAHHSFATEFDRNKPVRLEGKVVNEIRVDARTRQWATVALERMLAIKGTGNPIGKQQPVGTTVD